MPQTVERRGGREAPSIAPPLAASAAVEAAHGVIPVDDTVSRSILAKSNAAVSSALDGTLKSSLNLSRSLFGSLGLFSTILGGLGRMLKGV